MAWTGINLKADKSFDKECISSNADRSVDAVRFEDVKWETIDLSACEAPDSVRDHNYENLKNRSDGRSLKANKSDFKKKSKKNFKLTETDKHGIYIWFPVWNE